MGFKQFLIENEDFLDLFKQAGDEVEKDDQKLMDVSHTISREGYALLNGMKKRMTVKKRQYAVLDPERVSKREIEELEHLGLVDMKDVKTPEGKLRYQATLTPLGKKWVSWVNADNVKDPERKQELRNERMPDDVKQTKRQGVAQRAMYHSEESGKVDNSDKDPFMVVSKTRPLRTFFETLSGYVERGNIDPDKSFKRFGGQNPTAELKRMGLVDYQGKVMWLTDEGKEILERFASGEHESIQSTKVPQQKKSRYRRDI